MNTRDKHARAHRRLTLPQVVQRPLLAVVTYGALPLGVATAQAPHSVQASDDTARLQSRASESTLPSLPSEETPSPGDVPPPPTEDVAEPHPTPTDVGGAPPPEPAETIGETSEADAVEGEHSATEDAASEPSTAAKPLRSSSSLTVKADSGSESTEPEPMFGSFEGTYGLSGITTGFSFGPGGYYIGGEVSIVKQFREFTWLGAYIDGVYDFGRDQSRFSIGPEFGWSAIGIDGGFLITHDSGGTQMGFTVRPLLTMGVVSAYVRASHVFDPGTTWLETGLLLKYPVEF